MGPCTGPKFATKLGHRASRRTSVIWLGHRHGSVSLSLVFHKEPIHFVALDESLGSDFTPMIFQPRKKKKKSNKRRHLRKVKASREWLERKTSAPFGRSKVLWHHLFCTWENSQHLLSSAPAAWMNTCFWDDLYQDVFRPRLSFNKNNFIYITVTHRICTKTFHLRSFNSFKASIY